jgi:hypothetical protein
MAPFDRKAFKKVAAKQSQQRPKIAGRPTAQRRLGFSRNPEGIDVERIGFDLNLLAIGDQPCCGRTVDQWPQLGKAPAQLASRIIRDIPKQLAQFFAGNRPRRYREVGEERADFSRRRLEQRASIPDDLQRSQQKHAVRRQARHFHDRSNARSNDGGLQQEVLDIV